MALDADDLGLLRFERQPWASSTAKAAAIRDQFGLTPLRYYQRLNTLVDNPEALAVDPVLIHRLQRIRDRRAASIHRRPENTPRA